MLHRGMSETFVTLSKHKDATRQKYFTIFRKNKISLTHARLPKSYSKVEGEWEYAAYVGTYIRNDEIMLH